ncbi:N-acetylglucosamine-6-phosphate deacetylase, partial [Candidatus Bipolaricaulota bacterium]|nr:N-acetylglucosamine-6-phosphate deacetylase [Candidatus Bipolaricaulota bacterium]
VTLAPELPGADRLIARIKEIRAIPSLGHSDATYSQTIEAFEQGISLVTHMFNAMSRLHHREPGAIGAALDSEVMVELICDEIHVHPAIVRLLLKAKGIDEICLITDSISAAGLADGKYSLGGLDVFVQAGQARLADGTLSGSTLTMDQAVKKFIEFTGCTLSDAVKTATLNPAKLLKIDERKGSLEEGKDADIVVFDADFNIHYTIINGKIVYERKTRDYGC